MYTGREQHIDILAEIHRRIDEAMWPFKTNGLTAEVVERLNGPTQIIIDIKSLPNDTFVMEDDWRLRLFQRQDPYFLATEVGIAAGRHFAKVYQKPEDNIHLGEE